MTVWTEARCAISRAMSSLSLIELLLPPQAHAPAPPRLVFNKKISTPITDAW